MMTKLTMSPRLPRWSCTRRGSSSRCWRRSESTSTVGTFRPAELLADAKAAFPFWLIAFEVCALEVCALLEDAELLICPWSHTFAADDSWSLMFRGGAAA